MEAVAFKTKPDKRVYVLARDPDTQKTKSITVYGVTPEQFVESVRAASNVPRRRPNRRRAA